MASQRYHCILCDQSFAADDKVTHCPNSKTNSHSLIVITVRPDSQTQDCRDWSPKKQTLRECWSDGHYMCNYCANFTPEDARTHA